MILKKIYDELVLIRKELRAIRHSGESLQEKEIRIDRVPYGRSYRMAPKQRYTDQ